MGVLSKYMPFEKPWALLISMALHASLFVLPLAFLPGGQPAKERIITAHLMGEFQVTAAHIDSVKPSSPIDAPSEESAGTKSIARRSLSERPPVERVMAAEKAMAAEKEGIIQDRNGTGIDAVRPQLSRPAQLDTPEDDHAGQSATMETFAARHAVDHTDAEGLSGDIAEGSMDAQTFEPVKDPPGSTTGEAGMLAMIRERIRGAQYYPPIARKRGWEGTSTVRFCINESGGVKSIEVIRSSGITALDQATIKAVEKGTPYPPMTGWIQLPVHYQLIGSALEY